MNDTWTDTRHSGRKLDVFESEMIADPSQDNTALQPYQPAFRGVVWASVIGLSAAFWVGLVYLMWGW